MKSLEDTVEILALMEIPIRIGYQLLRTQISLSVLSFAMMITTVTIFSSTTQINVLCTSPVRQGAHQPTMELPT